MSAPIDHPSWCIGHGCEARGWHVSRRLTVDADMRTTGQDLDVDQAAAALRLVQLLAADVEPHVTLTNADEDDRFALLLTLRQARILRRLLYRLTALAE
jgi:hypothetical protein